jgi:hypothetical protein
MWAVAALVAGGALSSSPAAAQVAPCVDVCRVTCVKPISIADRWDDATGIPGYMGEQSGNRRRPDWRNNVQYDREVFTDADGNGLHDPGEAYVDDNANGTYDAELYDPLLTGYAAGPDRGLELVLHPGSTFDAPAPGQYLSVGLPPVNKGTPDMTSESYRLAWSGCAPTPVEPGDLLQPTPGTTTGPTNQAMRDLIAQDPNAEWDDATQSITGSSFALSPRVWFVPVHDPRIPFVSGAPRLIVRKAVAFFAERMVGTAQVQGRLLRVAIAGEACTGGVTTGGFIVTCPVPAAESSWGRVKATYR